MSPSRPQRSIIGAGALLGGTGVVLGAFGAHGLERYTGTAANGAWDTAVSYQLVHAVVLIVIGLLGAFWQSRALAAAGWSMLIGVLLFSGSIYGLTLGGPRILGPVTPLGGSALILGWLLFLVAAWRARVD